MPVPISDDEERLLPLRCCFSKYAPDMLSLFETLCPPMVFLLEMKYMQGEPNITPTCKWMVNYKRRSNLVDSSPDLIEDIINMILANTPKLSHTNVKYDKDTNEFIAVYIPDECDCGMSD